MSIPEQVDFQKNLDTLERKMMDEGYSVEYGLIGKRSTYALLIKGDVEIVGTTHMKGPLSSLVPVIGKYKALVQAVQRKYISYDLISGGMRND